VNTIAKSIVAVVLGLISIIFLSVGTDLLMRRFGILALNGVLMSNLQFLLAFSYRVLISIFGCYLAARLAPNRPMKHALALGIIGLVFSALGVAASYARPDLGPHWYPIALLVVTLPCAYTGGKFAEQKQTTT
jgi:uncharacterized membrane protein (DUF485 family)